MTYCSSQGIWVPEERSVENVRNRQREQYGWYSFGCTSFWEKNKWCRLNFNIHVHLVMFHYSSGCLKYDKAFYGLFEAFKGMDCQFSIRYLSARVRLMCAKCCMPANKGNLLDQANQATHITFPFWKVLMWDGHFRQLCSVAAVSSYRFYYHFGRNIASEATRTQNFPWGSMTQDP